MVIEFGVDELISRKSHKLPDRILSAVSRKEWRGLAIASEISSLRWLKAIYHSITEQLRILDNDKVPIQNLDWAAAMSVTWIYFIYF